MSGFREPLSLAATSVLDGSIHASHGMSSVGEYPVIARRIKPMPKRRRTSLDDGPEYESHGQHPASIGHPVIHANEAFKGSLTVRPLASSLDGFSAHSSRPDTPPASANGNSVYMGVQEDSDTADGDYVDHLQQPNNTKKRKVPTAPHQTQLSGSMSDGLGDSMYDYDAMKGEDDHDGHGNAAFGVLRRRKASAITIAGLQHKELLKRRRAQLAHILGALTASDELALDQALSARYINAAIAAPRPTDYIVAKGTKRHKRRRVLAPIQPTVEQDVRMKGGDFVFSCHSPSSDRMIAMRDEIQLLYTRFEAELARQAAKAAEAARQSQLALAAASGESNVGSVKRTSTRTSRPPAAPPPLESLPAAKGRQKKKKRSALANASNPHHLRNYVPSRLPHSGPLVTAQQQAANTANSISPLPLLFLSTDLPPRRRKKSDSPTRSRSVTPPASMTAGINPADEWICPFCEYNLFYGDENAFRRAIKSRKKVLQRRRRARERAAAAASGVVPATLTSSAPIDDAPVIPVPASSASSQNVTPTKAQAKRDRDKRAFRSAAA